ncbi:MAG TPA: hypothetical protein VGO78_05965 [Acidimicrobiales bacterium]|nr:hypothetical protein [Acidimicrobiales bacterium]
MTPPRRGPRHELPRRIVLAVALLALTALIDIDCLNLIQSEEWVDLSQAPHMAAVHRAPAAGQQRTTRHDDRDLLTVLLPGLVALPVAGALWRVISRRTIVRSTRPRFRPRLRAPPASPVLLGTP